MRIKPSWEFFRGVYITYENIWGFGVFFHISKSYEGKGYKFWEDNTHHRSLLAAIRHANTYIREYS